MAENTFSSERTLFCLPESLANCPREQAHAATTGAILFSLLLWGVWPSPFSHIPPTTGRGEVNSYLLSLRLKLGRLPMADAVCETVSIGHRVDLEKAVSCRATRQLGEPRAGAKTTNVSSLT